VHAIRPRAFAIGSGAAGSLGGVVANNIFAVTKNDLSQAYFVNLSGSSLLQFKNNAYFAINGGSNDWRTNSIFSSLSAWQAAVAGGDSGAIIGDPQTWKRRKRR